MCFTPVPAWLASVPDARLSENHLLPSVERAQTCVSAPPHLLRYELKVSLQEPSEMTLNFHTATRNNCQVQLGNKTTLRNNATPSLSHPGLGFPMLPECTCFQRRTMFAARLTPSKCKLRYLARKTNFLRRKHHSVQNSCAWTNTSRDKCSAW